MDLENLTIDLKMIIFEISDILGKPINKSSFEIINRGMPHKPKSLPIGKMGVYIFIQDDRFLKIRKVGSKSSARFLSQHYNPKSAQSTLAASILLDKAMEDKNVTEHNIGDWIKENCYRIDILLDSSLGIFALDLIEAALHYKYEPIYEGFATQR